MKRIKLSVDRLDENCAVLLAKGCEEEIIFPRFLLPSKTKEGDILTISLEVSGKDTEKAKAEVQALLKRLGKKTTPGISFL